MRSSFRSLVLSLLAGALVLGVCGCGPAKTIVKGRVTKGGKPLTVSSKGVLQIIFVPVVEGTAATMDTYPATILDAEAGTFLVKGRDGKGIPPGKYRVAIMQMDPYPTADKLGGRFGTQASQIFREVTGKDEEMVIDVAKAD